MSGGDEEDKIIARCIAELRALGDSDKDWSRRKKLFREGALAGRQKDGRPRKLSENEEREIWWAYRTSKYCDPTYYAEPGSVLLEDENAIPIDHLPIRPTDPPDKGGFAAIAKEFGVTPKQVERAVLRRDKWLGAKLRLATKPT